MCENITIYFFNAHAENPKEHDIIVVDRVIGQLLKSIRCKGAKVIIINADGGLISRRVHSNRNLIFFQYLLTPVEHSLG